MALDAGSVYTVLGFRMNPAGLAEYDAANKRAIASASAAEGANGRLAAAHGRVASAAQKAASASARMGEALPLKTIDLAAKHSSEAGKNLATLGTVARTGAAVGILALGAATVYAAKTATNFNREMLKIATQAGGTHKEVKQLSTSILGLAGQVPQGPKELAESLYHVESAGFRGKTALDLVKAAAQGAALGNANLENTTQAMIAATASQIKGVHGASDAMGQLNAIVGVGDMRMEGLAKAMATGLLPSAHDAGLSLKDVGAALATVTDNATPADVTATRLRMTIALMAAPSKAATKQLESIGLTSTSLAHDMRQPNGLLLAIEDLKTHLHASGKSAEEQDAVLSKVFGGGKSSAVIHTLVSETDRLKTKYDELGKSDGVHKLAKSWAEFQKSEAAGFGELKSGAEAFAITVGNVVMPELTKLAHGGAKALQEFVQTGGAAKVGEGITHAFSTLGQVVTNLAPPLLGVAHALISIGSAAGLGNAAELSTLAAGFLAFKGAAFVAPMLLQVAGAFSTLVVGLREYSAGSGFAAFATDLAAAIGPLKLVAIGAAIAAGAFVAFRSGLFDSASAAEKNAAALERDRKAVEGVQDATGKAASAQLGEQRAKLTQKEAGEQLKKVEKEVADGQLKGAAATNALLAARIAYAQDAQGTAAAHKQAATEIDNETHTIEKAESIATSRQAEIFKEIETTKKRIAAAKQSAASHQEVGALEAKLARQQADYNARGREAAQVIAQLNVAQESRTRILHGLSAIEAQNAQGVQNLQNALFQAGAPKKIVTRYELEDQGAQAKLGNLAAKLAAVGRQQVVAKVLTTAPNAASAIEALRAVIAGVPASKVVRILHNAGSAAAAVLALRAVIAGVPVSKVLHIITTAPSAQSAVEALRSAIASLNDRTVTITTINRQINEVGTKVIKGLKGFASGRADGPREVAMVGEGHGPEYVIDPRTGHGVRIDQPTVMGLSADDYVIPMETRFRGRAMGLFMALARDMNIPGYRHGRAPARKHRPVPPAIDPLSLPLSDIETKEQASKTKYDKAASKVSGAEGKVHAAEKSVRYASPKARGKAQAKLKEAKAELARARKAHDYVVEQRSYERWVETLREAKDYQAKIDHETALANIAGNDMKVADNRNDEGGYRAAKSRRVSALAALKGLIVEARKHVKTGTPYFDKLSEEVGSHQLEEEQAAGEEPKTARDVAAEREEQTGMTDAEAARLKNLEARASLAALTPDLADDKQVAQELVGFLEGVLGEVQAEPGARGGDSSIKSIADQLKTARGNVASFAGTATNENADLQAQISQANQKAELAQRGQQIAEQALAVFGGSGDIGAGGRNAKGAVIQNNYMLHPADPAVLTTIGNAAVAGIGYQGSRRAVRQQVGP